MRKKKIKFLLFADLQIMDVAGPVAVFEGANALLSKDQGYEISLAAASPDHTVASNGCIAMKAHEKFCDVDLSGVDTVMVPGGSKGTPAAMQDLAMRALIQDAAKRGIRVASVCTGAFVLAAAGILDGCKCTTHWGEMEKFQRLFPAIEVLRNVVFYRDGNVWTSAGVSTGIDMALAMVAEDFGRAIALQIARNLVLYVARPGNFEQISEFVREMPSIESKMNELVNHIRLVPNDNHSVAEMAERCNMSTRNFSRKFKELFGQTPAHLVREARVDRAKFLMQTSGHSLKRISILSGFSSTDVMRQAINATDTRAGKSRKHQ